jgi:hypothetical protein
MAGGDEEGFGLEDHETPNQESAFTKYVQVPLILKESDTRLEVKLTIDPELLVYLTRRKFAGVSTDQEPPKSVGVVKDVMLETRPALVEDFVRSTLNGSPVMRTSPPMAASLELSWIDQFTVISFPTRWK